MKYRLIAYAMSALIRALPPETVKALIDDLVDKIEDQFTDNPVVMKTIEWLREITGIPDDVGGDPD